MQRTANFDCLTALNPLKRDAAQVADYYSHFVGSSNSKPISTQASGRSLAIFDREASDLVFCSRTRIPSRPSSPLIPTTPPPPPIRLSRSRPHFFFESSSLSTSRGSFHFAAKFDLPPIPMARSDTLDGNSSSNGSSLDYQGTLESLGPNTPDESLESSVLELAEIDEGGLPRVGSRSKRGLLTRLWKQLGRVGGRRVKMVKSIERRTDFISE
ncbi:hypothetical protein FRB96_007808 [Tulasnella sp. 330]|nr:hypothetical protein FRB96_007808 [Tulasnella sp. 330]KAG8872137.1 hypothetical protein FRB97_008007 [Tulasnella sp. 331]KAG8878532.1 hypothetical protein FRB98_006097 [Tulasnella sp. 332]